MKKILDIGFYSIKSLEKGSNFHEIILKSDYKFLDKAKILSYFREIFSQQLQQSNLSIRQSAPCLISDYFVSYNIVETEINLNSKLLEDYSKWRVLNKISGINIEREIFSLKSLKSIETKGGPGYKVLVTGVDKTYLNNLMMELLSNNINISYFVPDSIAAFYFYKKYFLPDTVYLVIHAGLFSTTLIFIIDKVPVYIRQIPYGGYYITHRLTKLRNIELNEAERLKKELIMFDSEASDFFLIEPLFFQYFNELKKTFDYFNLTYNKKKKDVHLYLSGGGLNFKGILKFFEETVESVKAGKIEFEKDINIKSKLHSQQSGEIYDLYKILPYIPLYGLRNLLVKKATPDISLKSDIKIEKKPGKSYYISLIAIYVFTLMTVLFTGYSYRYYRGKYLSIRQQAERNSHIIRTSNQKIKQYLKTVDKIKIFNKKVDKANFYIKRAMFNFSKLIETVRQIITHNNFELISCEFNFKALIFNILVKGNSKKLMNLKRDFEANDYFLTVFVRRVSRASEETAEEKEKPLQFELSGSLNLWLTQ